MRQSSTSPDRPTDDRLTLSPDTTKNTGSSTRTLTCSRRLRISSAAGKHPSACAAAGGPDQTSRPHTPGQDQPEPPAADACDRGHHSQQRPGQHVVDRGAGERDAADPGAMHAAVGEDAASTGNAMTDMAVPTNSANGRT